MRDRGPGGGGVIKKSRRCAARLQMLSARYGKKVVCREVKYNFFSAETREN